MPETEWQKKEDERFYKNVHIVEKIADLFGLQIIGFNPSWHIEQKYPNPGSSFDISDDFMGKVATLLGYEWDFNKDIYEDINSQEKWVEQLRLRLRDAENHNKSILDMLHKEDEMAEHIKSNLDACRKHDEKSFIEAKERLNNLKKVVEIRDRLISQGIVRR